MGCPDALQQHARSSSTASAFDSAFLAQDLLRRLQDPKRCSGSVCRQKISQEYRDRKPFRSHRDNKCPPRCERPRATETQCLRGVPYSRTKESSFQSTARFPESKKKPRVPRGDRPACIPTREYDAAPSAADQLRCASRWHLSETQSY